MKKKRFQMTLGLAYMSAGQNYLNNVSTLNHKSTGLVLGD